MSEIIGIHIGQCGTKIGQQFWQQIAQQHKILTNNPKGILNFFQENKINYKAKSIFCDLQSSTYQSIIHNDINQLHRQENILVGKQNSKNLYSQGFYMQGKSLNQQIIQKIMKQVGKSNNLSGFIFTTAISGGTGSGLSSLIVKDIVDNYPNKIVQGYVLLPDRDCIISSIDIYNTIFGLSSFVNYGDMITILENNSAQKILLKQGIRSPSFKNINKLFGKAITQGTSSYRFSGKLNTSQRKIVTNLILFPRIKFLYQSLSQYSSKFSPLESALMSKNYLAGQKYQKHKNYYTMAVNCRGYILPQDQVYQIIKKSDIQKNKLSIEWLPCPYHLSFCDTINQNYGQSTTTLINSPQIIEPFKLFSQLFTSQFRRRSFVHHYTSCGMDQMQFTQAQSNINDIISQHIPQTNYYDQDYLDDDQ